MDRYDVVTVGGGIAASALGKAMAEHGARVLVVERERAFRDRVRGEALAPWGVAELDALGLLDAVRPAIADELRAWRFFIAGMVRRGTGAAAPRARSRDPHRRGPRSTPD